MDKIFRNIIDNLKSAEKHSSGGCIKLQTAIDIVKQAASEYDASRITLVLNKSKSGSYSILDSLKNMRTNGWISCNDHLPEPQDLRKFSINDCTEYLVQRRSGSMDVAHFITVYGESYFEANSIELKDVVAWQPRPKKYEPDDSARKTDSVGDLIRRMSNKGLANLLEKAENAGYNDSSIAPRDSKGFSIDLLDWIQSCDKESLLIVQRIIEEANNE